MRIFALLFLTLAIGCTPSNPEPTDDAMASPIRPLPHIRPKPPLIVLPPPPPEIPDTRPQAEIDQAACQGADGTWRCSKIKKRPVLKSSVGGDRPPIYPASWGVAAWCVDGQNVSGSASDNNNCTSCSTPCLTWKEIYNGRWGCVGLAQQGCPRLNGSANVGVTFNSSQQNATDPVGIRYVQESGHQLTLRGLTNANNQIATGTIAGLVAKNRTTGVELKINQLSASSARGHLIVNSTHPSEAFIMVNTAGVLTMTQPISGGTGLTPVEVDTWANTDSITEYALSQVNVIDFSPTYAQTSAAILPGVMTDLATGSLASNGFANPSIFNGPVILSDVWMQNELVSIATTGAFPAATFNDVYMDRGAVVKGFSASGNVPDPNPTATSGMTIIPRFTSGSMDQVLNTYPYDFTNVWLDGDISVGSTGSLINVSGSTNYFGCVDISNGLLSINQGWTLTPANTTCNSATQPIIWNGLINLYGFSRLTYNGQTAANSFPLSSFNINSFSNACSWNASATPTFNCNIALSNAHLDAAQGAAGFGGLAFLPHGGAISKTAD